MSKEQTIYYIENECGDLMRVPESKLKEFLEMQKGQKSSVSEKETYAMHSCAKLKKQCAHYIAKQHKSKRDDVGIVPYGGFHP